MNVFCKRGMISVFIAGLVFVGTTNVFAETVAECRADCRSEARWNIVLSCGLVGAGAVLGCITAPASAGITIAACLIGIGATAECSRRELVALDKCLEACQKE